jgi:hypothetical protein
MFLKTTTNCIIATLFVLILTVPCTASEPSPTIFKEGDNCEVVYAANGAPPAPTRFSVVKVGNYPWILVKTTRQPVRAIGAQQGDERSSKAETTREVWINVNWILTVTFVI